MLEFVEDIAIFGRNLTDPAAIEQLKKVVQERDGVRGALMSDGHVGYVVPIGGVVAYENAICVSGVGYDIACGNKAVLTDVDASWLLQNRNRIADEIFSNVSFGVGRANAEDVDHPLFDDERFSLLTNIYEGKLKDLAREQLGTVGSGNHYVDVFVDDKNRVWVGVHFGSRGFGHKITNHFLKAAGVKDDMDGAPCVLSLNDQIGQDYFDAVRLAGEYAYAGRDWVCQKVASILGGKILHEVHNHHNFAWEEEHDGRKLIVVRKGATPAFPGQEGFVGGSMGDISVILEGVDSEDSKKALYSTIHGAGRVMSRTKASGKSRWKNGKKVKISSGEVSESMMHEWIAREGVTLRGAGTDESPHCYKRIEEVLKAHEGTIRVKEVLHPVIVCMSPKETTDPYSE